MGQALVICTLVLTGCEMGVHKQCVEDMVKVTGWI